MHEEQGVICNSENPGINARIADLKKNTTMGPRGPAMGSAGFGNGGRRGATWRPLEGRGRRQVSSSSGRTCPAAVEGGARVSGPKF